ncbi:hypothetical protein HMPREF1624_03649 [Sporothrix schenckii ATCC 58251]|uniref:ATPase AAA-type core domain-containing protein n=1 Tax=Sporothrix schenckii (strain ATCC 58251 / de Perez 2211183) TaxID=1391915 RepID=U7PXE6_SPOS1|nr:hypothetical protein HMPREF1624_03649 [Sporothrix schenckii ATCC 58251]
MEGSEVMERIMGLFGLEGFKKHCLSLYERIVSVPVPLRPSEAGNTDIFIEGNEGAGQDLAALRYRELLVSLQVIPRPSLIHYFTEEPASFATALQTVNKTLVQNVDSPSKKSWTTLESSARMLRQRRLRPYWTTTGAITIAALESADHYYGSCHLLGEKPWEVRARVSEYEQLMQMVGLDGVKANVTALVESEQRNQQQRLYNNETRLSRYQRAALHRCFVGPPGTGRRTVAKLYARILWRLGLVEGMETVTLSLASLIGLTRQDIERHVHNAFTDTKNVGVVIVEDICINGLSFAVQETSNNAKREDSDEEDSNGDEQDDGGGDIDAIHDKLPPQAVRHRNHEIRPFIFDLLAKRVKTLDVQDTGPVLVLVGLATQSSGANLARLPLQLTDSKRDMDSSHASISSSLRQLFLRTTQTISLRPYSVGELSLLLERRLSRQHGQPWPMDKADLRAMRIARLRPSFDNICFVERVALHAMRFEASRASTLDDMPSDEGDSWHRRSESSSSTVPSNNDAKIAQRSSGRVSSSPTVRNLFGLGHIVHLFETIDTTATHLTQG